MVSKNIEIIIKKISKYNDEVLKEYLYNEKIEVLHSIKNYVDDIYYNSGEYTYLSDEQYDILKDIIKERDPGYKVPVGAKIRVGENRVKLPYWLGSMDKIKAEDINEIAKWVSKNYYDEYIVENKLDGVSCLLININNEIKLYTRGDGYIGSDISYLSKYINNIPKSILENINIRGELIIKKDIFESKYKTKYANPRNMVSGLVGSKTLREGISDLEFIAYEIIGDELMMKPSEQLKKLSDIGFQIVEHQIIYKLTVEKLIEILTYNKVESPYEIDGLIVQSNREYYRNVSDNPEYAFAFKMRLDSNLVNAEVEEVEWNISKWGIIKPRIRIKPISLGGVTITYTTGFNAKYIYDNKIQKGALIQITRSGDVIPYIVKVLKQGLEPEMPDIPYEWNETGVDIITYEKTDDICIKLLSSFFAHLGIKYVSEATITKLYDNGFNTLLKIISASKNDLQNIESFGERSAERIYTNIHAGLQNITIPSLLSASGIFGFGLGSKKIELLFNNIPDILSIYKNISEDDLMSKIMNIEGYSEKTALKIVQNIRWADKFILMVKPFVTYKKIEVASQQLKGMKFLMSGFRDKNLENEIIKRGGKITSSVSSNTTGLIVLNKQSSTGKIKKAEELNVPVYLKEEFINKFIN